jgi:hypothetical protein
VAAASQAAGPWSIHAAAPSGATRVDATLVRDVVEAGDVVVLTLTLHHPGDGAPVLIELVSGAPPHADVWPLVVLAR